MDKEIKGIIREIIVVLIILIGTYPIFSEASKNYSEANKMYANYINNYTLDNQVNNKTLTTSVNNSNKLVISKDTKDEASYKLYIEIDKSSTIDINNLMLMIDEKTYTLNDLYSYESDTRIFYLVNENNITNEDIILYNLYLNDNCNGTLIYNFSVV